MYLIEILYSHYYYIAINLSAILLKLLIKFIVPIYCNYNAHTVTIWVVRMLLKRAHCMPILHINGHYMGSARVINGAYVPFRVPITCPYLISWAPYGHHARVMFAVLVEIICTYGHTYVPIHVPIYVPIYVPTNTCPYRCPYCGHDVGTSAHIVPIYEICAHKNWQTPYMGTRVPIYVPIECPYLNMGYIWELLTVVDSECPYCGHSMGTLWALIVPINHITILLV